MRTLTAAELNELQSLKGLEHVSTRYIVEHPFDPVTEPGLRMEVIEDPIEGEKSFYILDGMVRRGLVKMSFYDCEGCYVCGDAKQHYVARHTYLAILAVRLNLALGQTV